MTPQVGILVVSHSAPLAEAAVALAQEVATGPLRLAVAAGVDDPEHPFGTDPTAVLAAVEALDSPAGVLVLMDLGSAVLSAELALELLPEDVQGRVRLSAAPLVEGLVAAAVQAAAGADLDRVAREAEAGLAGKRMHLGSDGPDATPAPPVPVPPDGPGQVGEWTIGPAHGLHARPAARLASILAGLDVQATATNATTGGGPVDATSTSLLVGLGLVHGHTLCLQVSGPDADTALQAVAALAADNFGDPVVASLPASAAASAARSATAGVAPSPAACSSASTAGARASTMVLSPTSAFPRRTTPSRPARQAVASVSVSSVAVGPAACPKERKNVPYRGPLAPPTDAIRAIATALPNAAASAGASASRAATTARQPRRRLVPWSASPMAASSEDRSSAWTSTASANRRSQATSSLTPSAPAVVVPVVVEGPPISCPTSARGCGRARPTGGSAPRRCASASPSSRPSPGR